MSEFRRAKLGLRFERLDADGNGYIEEGDYVHAAARMAAAVGRAPHSPEALLAEARLRQVWAGLAKMDTDGDGRIDLDEYVTAVERHPEAVALGVQDVADAIFDLCDLDGDARLDLGEFTLMMGGFDVPEGDCAEAFARIDLDGDGSISRAEFRQASFDLYLGDDPEAPGTWLVGRPATAG